MRGADWLCVTAGVLVLALGVGKVAAQGPALAGRFPAQLSVTLDEQGNAYLSFIAWVSKPPGASLEGGLSEAFGCPLRGVHVFENQGYYSLTARGEGMVHSRGLARECQIDLAPLVDRLRPLGVLQLDVSLSHPSRGESRCWGADRDETPFVPWSRYRCHVDVRQPAPPPLRLEYGYPPQDFLRFLPLAPLLLVPVGLTLWARRGALRRASADPAAWFGYFRFEGRLATGTWLGWWAALAVLDVAKIVTFIQGGETVGERTVVRACLFLMPPAVVVVVCKALGHAVSVQMRGTTWTLSERLRQAFWGQAVGWLPLLFGWATIDALSHQANGREIVLWAVAGLAGFQVALNERNRAWKLQRQALTTGALRDRIFALAAQAGQPLNQVYVLPMAQSREANAFVNVKARVVLLTDYLVQSLSQREVDAIVSHELGHLRKPPPGKLLGGVLGGAFSFVVVVVFVGGLGAEQYRWLPAFPLVAVLGVVVLSTWRSRRWERVADAEAVTLTGDPEALITALLKIAKLNAHPLRWSRWEEHVITHPSTLRRIDAIARQGGVSPERLQQLLEEGETAGERYELPAAVTREDKVYSTAYKGRFLRRISWLLLGVSLVTPALAAWIVEGGEYPDPVAWTIYAAGLLATPALVLGVVRAVGVWSDRGLKRALRARLEREGVYPDKGDGVFVGFSPGDRPRTFEGFSDWDLGFLLLAGDRLCYVGEQTRFALRPGQIEADFREARFPGWWRPLRVYVRWRDEEHGTSGVFNLRLADTLPASGPGERTRTLGQYLRAWQDQAPAPEALPGGLAGLSPPALGDVTGIAPGKMVNRRSLFTGLWLSLLLAAGVCVLLDLPFEPIPTSGACYVLLVVALNTLFQQLPYWRYREPAT
jgi:Zn-dependent protease with chaperone function